MCNSFELSKEEFHHLREMVKCHCGIALGDKRCNLIESSLERMASKEGCRSLADLYEKANKGIQSGLRDKIVDAMTINETYWFRDPKTFEILENHIFPVLVKQIKDGRKERIRIWSAGCSTGQEPYSIAMAAIKFQDSGKGNIADNLEIIGTDISSSALFLAMAGRYDKLSMGKGLDDAYKDKWFVSCGQFWVISKKIKSMVTFKKLNLQETFTELGNFDIVFMRNVLIYFSDNLKKKILNNTIRLLTSQKGFLVLGDSEVIESNQIELEPADHDGQQIYQART